MATPISSLADHAHNYGVSWYEQTTPLAFTKRRFVGSPQEPGSTGIVFSQPHALQMADMDGDGVPDVITGKTRLANPDGCGDPDLQGDPVNYVFKIKRDTLSAAGTVTFEPYPIDTSPAGQKVGVSRQIAVGHLNTDGVMDVCLATKLGLHVFLGQSAAPTLP